MDSLINSPVRIVRCIGITDILSPQGGIPARTGVARRRLVSHHQNTGFTVQPNGGAAPLPFRRQSLVYTLATAEPKNISKGYGTCAVGGELLHLRGQRTGKSHRQKGYQPAGQQRAGRHYSGWTNFPRGTHQKENRGTPEKTWAGTVEWGQKLTPEWTWVETGMKL